MSWQCLTIRGLRAACTQNLSKGALSACMLHASQPCAPSAMNKVVAAAFSRSAMTPSAMASVRSLHSSMPFSAASLLQQQQQQSRPCFPPAPQAASVSTSSTAVGEAGEEGSSSGSSLVGVEDDDDETLEPRNKARLKKPPDLKAASFQDPQGIAGSSEADGERIYFLSDSQRLQRPLSREAAAYLHHLAKVKESKGDLHCCRMGKEGLSKAFLASVGDSLQAHGLVKVQVPKKTGVEAEFAAFCLEASQDCVALGVKGNTCTVYRDNSLPRPPSTYADIDATLAELQQQQNQQHARPSVVMHSHNHAHEQNVLQQLMQQQGRVAQTQSGGGTAVHEACERLDARMNSHQELVEHHIGHGRLPALKHLDLEDEEGEMMAQAAMKQRSAGDDTAQGKGRRMSKAGVKQRGGRVDEAALNLSAANVRQHGVGIEGDSRGWSRGKAEVKKEVIIAQDQALQKPKFKLRLGRVFV